MSGLRTELNWSPPRKTVPPLCFRIRKQYLVRIFSFLSISAVSPTKISMPHFQNPVNTPISMEKVTWQMWLRTWTWGDHPRLSRDLIQSHESLTVGREGRRKDQREMWLVKTLAIIGDFEDGAREPWLKSAVLSRGGRWTSVDIQQEHGDLQPEVSSIWILWQLK